MTGYLFHKTGVTPATRRVVRPAASPRGGPLLFANAHTAVPAGFNPNNCAAQRRYLRRLAPLVRPPQPPKINVTHAAVGEQQRWHDAVYYWRQPTANNSPPPISSPHKSSRPQRKLRPAVLRSKFVTASSASRAATPAKPRGRGNRGLCPSRASPRGRCASKPLCHAS